MLLHHQRTDKCICQQQTPWFKSQVYHRRQPKLTSGLKIFRESLYVRVIRRGFLAPNDFYLWASLKIKRIKLILTPWKKSKTKTNARFQIISGQKFQRVKPASSSGVLRAFGQVGDISSICCTTGQLSLDFLKDIIRANIFPRFLHRLLNLPRLGVWRDASGKSGGRWSVKQEKKHLFKYVETSTELIWLRKEISYGLF